MLSLRAAPGTAACTGRAARASCPRPLRTELSIRPNSRKVFESEDSSLEQYFLLGRHARGLSEQTYYYCYYHYCYYYHHSYYYYYYFGARQRWS